MVAAVMSVIGMWSYRHVFTTLSGRRVNRDIWFAGSVAGGWILVCGDVCRAELARMATLPVHQHGTSRHSRALLHATASASVAGLERMERIHVSHGPVTPASTHFGCWFGCQAQRKGLK